MALQVRGFRPTAVCGPLAAVATAGKLLGLDARQLANSLAIAASEAGGLRPNDGDPSAAILLQTGTAVRVGHAAIRLSEAGVRGHPRALEAPGGFLEAYSGRKTVPVVPDGANWAILGTAVKLHATAHTLAPVIDMMLRLRREHDLPLDRIERIVVIVPEAHIKISGGKKPMPATAADATANYPFGVAAALVDGDYLWPATVDRLLTDPAVARLAALVEVRSDPTHTAEFDSGDKLWPATVEVVVDGKTLRATVDRPDGADYNPEAVAAVTRKFEALVTQWPTTVDAQAIRDYVMNMETADDFFAGLLAATARFGSDAMQLRS
jgi:2-methylcitrate dehydratase PrpD